MEEPDKEDDDEFLNPISSFLTQEKKKLKKLQPIRRVRGKRRHKKKRRRVNIDDDESSITITPSDESISPLKDQKRNEERETPNESSIENPNNLSITTEGLSVIQPTYSQYSPPGFGKKKIRRRKGKRKKKRKMRKNMLENEDKEGVENETLSNMEALDEQAAEEEEEERRRRMIRRAKKKKKKRKKRRKMKKAKLKREEVVDIQEKGESEPQSSPNELEKEGAEEEIEKRVKKLPKVVVDLEADEDVEEKKTPHKKRKSKPKIVIEKPDGAIETKDDFESEEGEEEEGEEEEGEEEGEVIDKEGNSENKEEGDENKKEKEVVKESNYEYETDKMGSVSKSMSDFSSVLRSYGRKTVNFLNTFSFKDPKSHEIQKQPSPAQPVGGTGGDSTAAPPVIQPSQTEQHTLLSQELKFAKPILSISINRAGFLDNVLHPHVKVTFIDLEQKKLLEKKNANENCSAHFEYCDHEQKMFYVLPQTTHPYNMRKQRSPTPTWNEELLFNDYFFNFVRPNVVAIFEIIDFIPERKKQVHIAWGFLQMVSSSGRANIGKSIPIQLYKYPDVFFSYKGGKGFSFQGREYRLSKLSGKLFSSEKVEKNILFPHTTAYLLYSAKGGFLSNKRKKFPSVLHVSCNPCEKPLKEIVRFPKRAKSIFQREIGTESFNRIHQENKMGGSGGINDVDPGLHQQHITKEEQKRKALLKKQIKRDKRENCKIPDQPLYQFETGELGCLRVEFSPSSQYLAIGCCGKKNSQVSVYDVYSGNLIKEFDGHIGIIYDLDWSDDESIIVSASQDGTARVWNFNDKSGKYGSDVKCIKTIFHPCFVYCIKYFNPNESLGGRITSARRRSSNHHHQPPKRKKNVEEGEGEGEGEGESGDEKSKREEQIEIEEKDEDEHDSYIITGAYDGQIRVYNSKTFELFEVISTHKSRINSILFDSMKRKMYVADGSGVISVWSCDFSEDSKEFLKIKEIREKHILKASLTCMRKHPRYNYLFFVHSQDNLIRCIDINQKGKTINYFGGVKCYLNSQKANITPDLDGTYIVSGSSENGKVFFWDRFEEKLVHPDGFDFGFGSNPVYDIAWSKTDHLIAVCSYGNPEPVRMYCFKKSELDVDDEQELIDKTHNERRFKKMLLTSKLKGIFARRKKTKNVGRLFGESVEETMSKDGSGGTNSLRNSVQDSPSRLSINKDED